MDHIDNLLQRLNTAIENKAIEDVYSIYRELAKKR